LSWGKLFQEGDKDAKSAVEQLSHCVTPEAFKTQKPRLLSNEFTLVGVV
jgi:hypothetical protein